MQRITRSEALGYRLDGSLAPVLWVGTGEEFVVETEDASSGLLTDGTVLPTPENLPYLRRTPVQSNPVAGPIHVSGIHAGDRVRVKITALNVAASGVTWGRPAASPLGDSRDWSELGQAFVCRVEHRDGKAFVSNSLSWDLTPMIGTIACAPDWESLSTSSGQGPWGGNLDVCDFRAGSAIYLNAYHDGGLLFIGDVHGCQGDGEYSGIADETRAEVRLRVEPSPGGLLPYPRVETDERIIALWVDKPLEAAAHGAIRHLLNWLVDELGFSRREAYLTVSLNPAFRLHVYQMTSIHDIGYTVGASLPKGWALSHRQSVIGKWDKS